MWAIQTCVSCFWPAPSSCIKDCTPQRCSRPLSDDRQLPRARVADCAHDLQPTRGDELRAHGRLVHELILALPHPLLRREGSGGSARPHPLPRLMLHPLVHVARGRPALPDPLLPALLPALLPLTTPPWLPAARGCAAQPPSSPGHSRQARATSRGRWRPQSRAPPERGAYTANGPPTGHSPPAHQPTHPPGDQVIFGLQATRRFLAAGPLRRPTSPGPPGRHLAWRAMPARGACLFRRAGRAPPGAPCSSRQTPSG